MPLSIIGKISIGEIIIGEIIIGEISMCKIGDVIVIVRITNQYELQLPMLNQYHIQSRDCDQARREGEEEGEPNFLFSIFRGSAQFFQ